MRIFWQVAVRLGSRLVSRHFIRGESCGLVEARSQVLASVAGFLILCLLQQCQPAALAQKLHAKPAQARKKQAASHWRIFSNSNEIEALVVLDERIFAATSGGVVEWDIATHNVVKKWTVLDGLPHNHPTSICKTPNRDAQIVIGSPSGLGFLNPRTNKWQSMTPNNSKMRSEYVTAVACDPSTRNLYIGYAYSGVDVFSQTNHTWRQIDKAEGLTANMIGAFAVAGPGEAWVTSSFGISLITESGVKNQNMLGLDPLVASGLKKWLAIDHAKNVWGVSPEGHLIGGSAGNWKNRELSSLEKVEFHFLGGIAFDRTKSVLYGAIDRKLYKFDPSTEKCQPFTFPFDVREINQLVADQRGRLFVATEQGVKMFDPRHKGSWSEFTLKEEVLQSNSVRAIAEDNNGIVWIATDKWVYKINEKDPKGQLIPVTKEISSPAVTALCPDPKGGMWFGAKGVDFFDGSNWKNFTRRDGLANDTVRAIAIDGKGRTWIGTVRGISIWDGTKFTNLTISNGLPCESIHALYADVDTIWAATDNGLLRIFDGKWKSFDEDAVGPESNQMRAVARRPDGRFFVGTNFGVGVFDGMQGVRQEEAYGEQVSSIAAGKDGSVWIGTDFSGVHHFDGKEWRRLTTFDGLPSLSISCMFLDNLGTVWIGTTDEGFARYTP